MLTKSGNGVEDGRRGKLDKVVSVYKKDHTNKEGKLTRTGEAEKKRSGYDKQEKGIRTRPSKKGWLRKTGTNAKIKTAIT